MIELSVREARVYFSGQESDLAGMFKALRLKDKNAFWKAKFLIRKLTGYGMSEEERTEKIAKIKESAKWIRFYDRRTDSFPTGLLPRVIRRLDKRHVRYEIEDLRRPLPKGLDDNVKFHFRDKVEERPEQIEALRKALKRGSGLLHAAPNFGKTEIACAIVGVFRKKIGRLPNTIFLVHRASLAIQTAERFRKHLGLRVHVIGGGKGKKFGGVTIATVQTASRMVKYSTAFKDWLSKTDIVFVDEFHVNKAKQVQAVMDRCRARMRFGLSGTIDRTSKEKLLRYVGMTGPIVAEISNRELIALGRSAQPHIRLVEVPGWEDTVDGSYGTAYRECIVKDKKRNKLVRREAIRYADKDMQVLVTVSRIRHGLILRDMFESRDIRCEFMSGSTPMFIRKKILDSFKGRRFPVLIASPIFDTGMDVPEIQAWVNAAGGKGWELVVQRLGRTLRRKKERNVVFITDFLDRRSPYLAKHSLLRWDYYKEEGAKIKIVRVGGDQS